MLSNLYYNYYKENGAVTRSVFFLSLFLNISVGFIVPLEHHIRILIS